MPSRREASSARTNVLSEIGHRPWVGIGSTRPNSEMAALMEAEPHCEPQTSRQQLLPLRECLQDAIDHLHPREAWVLNSIVVERLSLRAVARQLGLGKSQIATIRDNALNHLYDELADDPLVIEYLEGQ